MDKVNEFKNGIFALHTRRFGKVAELMIQKLFNTEQSTSLAYDALKENLRIEIKFSRALNKENQKPITDKNIIEQCCNACYLNRQILSTNLNDFDCNIQQVKPKEFDILYFGIFFNDYIEIYKITSDDVIMLPGYSNHQHRGNVGEGQFHLNNTNIDFYRNNYMIQKISYDYLLDLFQKGENL